MWHSGTGWRKWNVKNNYGFWEWMEWNRNSHKKAFFIHINRKSSFKEFLLSTSLDSLLKQPLIIEKIVKAIEVFGARLIFRTRQRAASTKNVINCWLFNSLCFLYMCVGIFCLACSKEKKINKSSLRKQTMCKEWNFFSI